MKVNRNLVGLLLILAGLVLLLSIVTIGTLIAQETPTPTPTPEPHLSFIVYSDCVTLESETHILTMVTK